MSLRMRVSAAESGANLRNEFFRVPILPLESGARNSDVPSVEEKWKQEEPGTGLIFRSLLFLTDGLLSFQTMILQVSNF